MTMKHSVKKNSFLILFMLASALAFAHDAGQGEANLSFSQQPPVAGVPVLIHIALFEENAKITQFDIVHERKLHTVFVGQDLLTTAHIHPENYPEGFANQSQGVYTVKHTFPKAGFYAALLDYSSNGKKHSAVLPFIVTGDENLPNITYDFSRTKQFGNYTVELKTPANITTGKNEFSLSIGKEKPVTDLQMYLGSEAHIAVIRENLQLGGHTHAHMAGIEHAGMQHYFGPEVPFEYTFAEPGVYALIGQFKHNGTVVTTQFLVNVTGEAVHIDEHEHLAETKTTLPFSVGWVFIAIGVALVVFALTRNRKKPSA